jgi:hypothetical protein
MLSRIPTNLLTDLVKFITLDFYLNSTDIVVRIYRALSRFISRYAIEKR